MFFSRPHVWFLQLIADSGYVLKYDTGAVILRLCG